MLTKVCIVKAMVFPVVICGSAGQESTYIVGDLGLTTGLGRSPGEGKATHWDMGLIPGWGIKIPQATKKVLIIIQYNRFPL